jgi:hypothetical protein
VIRLALSALLAVVAATPAQADAPWKVTRREGGSLQTCLAEGPGVGGANMSVVAFGPQLMMLVSSDKFQQDSGTYTLALSFDGGTPVRLNAEGHAGTYGVRVSPPLHAALSGAARMTASSDGNTYDFPLAGAGKAMDDVLACVGQGSYDALMSHGPADIAGSGWTIFDPTPGTNDCSIRANGGSIDTMVMVNKTGALVLVGARNDWERPGKSIEVTLRIGDGKAVTTKASALSNLVLLQLDDSQAQALRQATTLSWTLPWGAFDAQLRGNGAAIDALLACHKRRTGG